MAPVLAWDQLNSREKARVSLDAVVRRSVDEIAETLDINPNLLLGEADRAVESGRAADISVGNELGEDERPFVVASLLEVEGMTQRRAAGLLGVSKTTVHRWVSEVPDASDESAYDDEPEAEPSPEPEPEQPAVDADEVQPESDEMTAAQAKAELESQATALAFELYESGGAEWNAECEQAVRNQANPALGHNVGELIVIAGVLPDWFVTRVRRALADRSVSASLERLNSAGASRRAQIVDAERELEEQQQELEQAAAKARASKERLDALKLGRDPEERYAFLVEVEDAEKVQRSQLAAMREQRKKLEDEQKAIQTRLKELVHEERAAKGHSMQVRGRIAEDNGMSIQQLDALVAQQREDRDKNSAA